MKYCCPICKKPTDSDMDKDFPFCSERCRLTDLGNWATEKYKVTEPAGDEEVDERPELRGSDEADAGPNESEE